MTTDTTYAAHGGPNEEIADDAAAALFEDALRKALEQAGSGPVLLIPPDITRYHSRAGLLTRAAARLLGPRLGAVLPALGTHMPMTPAELARMYPGVPADKVVVHDWRNDVVELGRLPADWVEHITGGRVAYDWPAQVNRLLPSGGFSLIVSLGQVVPHEVVGMANHAKNLFVGTGGKEGIDKSHFAGAAYGMERMMGRADTPVRALFDEGLRRFGGKMPPVLFALTVVGTGGRRPPDPLPGGRALPDSPTTVLRGLFIGTGRECFTQAAKLARQVNVDLLDKPIAKAVVYLEPDEFRSTWLGNKAIYRTRMAMADGGELIILAPGLERFGEDRGVDALIRAYGYRPSADILARVGAEPDLAGSLSVAAHLIHGSPEGRFTVRYCPGPAVSRADIESVGYQWGDLAEAQARYSGLALGWNTLPGGETVFYVPNPALGLWAERRRFLGG